MMNDSVLFFNRCFDKKRLKNFILWFFNKYGERETIQLVENLKNIGFQYATKAGVSIGIDDLKIPFVKSDCINVTEQKIKEAEINYQIGNITEIERRQHFVDEWSFVSEKLKRHVIQFFKATDIFNPIYMMAFSGARGNISQIRQLIGMRGLMADPQGQILDFPIRSSFREGLTLTEYLISCYGARKGVVDTALRTATSGYLTRRLVDVTQQVVIGGQDCCTNRGIQFTDLLDGSKTLLSLKDRIIGRVLLNDVLVNDNLTKKKYKIGSKNQEISPRLSKKICEATDRILLRSPLTCFSKNSVCQLCYGWNLAYNAIVSIGEAAGILAAQSIGEPGTQLTMRTFHTGGVFTGGLIDQIYAPFSGEVNYINNFKGILIRTLQGRIGFLTKTEGALQVKIRDLNKLNMINSDYKTELVNLLFSTQLRINSINKNKIQYLLRKVLSIEKNLKAIKNVSHSSLIFNIPIHSILFIRHNGLILEKELIAELSSISDTRSQEAEQEIFSPTAGQIFFENLILIEKTKRDGSIQKITYGLGSLWVVSANELNSILYPKIFPSHGDFISKYSVIQILKIRMEKFYFFDKVLLDSINSLKKFKADFFLAPRKPGVYSKFSGVNNILLNHKFYSINFQKIYYQNFRYFVSINPKNEFFNIRFYSKINNLSSRDQFIKKKKCKLDSILLLLGLNFRFYQNYPVSKVKKPKSNFLLYNIYHKQDQFKSSGFFSLLGIHYLVKPKLTQPIVSRKSLDFQGKTIRKEKYQYWFWFDIYYLLIINVWNIPVWLFSKKKSLKSFDFIFSKRNNNFYLLYSSFLKKRKNKIEHRKGNIIQFQQYKISKFFFATLNFNKFFFNPSSGQVLKALKRYQWLTAAQAALVLVNRQSFINLQSFKFWRLQKKDIFQFPHFYSKTKEEIINISRLAKLFPYLSHFYSGKLYNTKSIVKPILINPDLLISIYNKKSYLKCYIIQSFLIYFYYEHFLDLKCDNYFSNFFKKEKRKIGFQTQIRISTIPTFVNIKPNNLKFPAKIKQIFLKNEIFVFLKIYNPLYHNKQQSHLNWPCTYQGKHFRQNFGCFLSFGIEFENDIYFDRQNILIDIIYNNAASKFNLLNFFSYRTFHKLNIRFTAHRYWIKNLIIFQKVENYINLKTYYSKISNLHKSYKNQEYHTPLAFNIINNYLTNFNKCSTLQKNRLLNFLYFNYPSFVCNKQIFFKKNFLQNIQVKTKTLSNLDYQILLNTYPSLTLRKKISKIRSFKSYAKPNNQIQLCISGNLMGIEYASKNFSLNYIQKVDIQALLNEKIKIANKIRIFYKKFEYSSIKNFIYIDFFPPSYEGEIIYTKFKKQVLERNFMILTRSNLAGFKLESQKAAVKSRALALGNFLRYGTRFENQKVISKNGQIIYVDKKQFIIREAIPFLITSKSLINVYHDEIVNEGLRLFTFLSHRVKTGDIIQGIPQIEEFFEARSTREGLPLIANLHTQAQQLFQTYRSQLPIFEATQRSFEKIQYLIIDEIQKVYCSQGIYIADKHLEIVVRQMTSKVQIINGGRTGLLAGELIELDWIGLIEQIYGNDEFSYEPRVLGITKSCLETESFISAASFQETTKILTKAAIQNKIDFIRGLKQNVILGNLIPAGTGFFPLYISNIQKLIKY